MDKCELNESEPGNSLLDMDVCNVNVQSDKNCFSLSEDSRIKVLDIRTRLFGALRNELLDRRRRILDGSEPNLVYEIKMNEEKSKEKRNMLGEKMERQRSLVSEQRRLALAAVKHEQEDALRDLKHKLGKELEKMKGLIEDKVNRMDLTDKRSIHEVFEYVNSRLHLEQVPPSDDDKARADSPTEIATMLQEKRAYLPGRLLDDHAIRDDLIQLKQSITDVDPNVREVAHLVRNKHRVTLSKLRLIYDSKTFYRGQKLFVQTTSYTRFPAIVHALADEYVHIKSRTPGDTREVFATVDDLRSGRVRIGRKDERVDPSE